MTGEELQDLRGLVRASRVALGRLVGVHETTVWRWEVGTGPVGLPAVALLVLREGVRAHGDRWGQRVVAEAARDHLRALGMLFAGPETGDGRSRTC